MLYPFPYFRNFTWGTPTIPDIYWNSYSYEERIKKLCMEYDKLVRFVDAMVDTVNEQYDIIDDMRTNLPAIVADTIKNDPEIHADILAKVDEYLNNLLVGRDYDTIAQHGFVYNPNI